MGKKSNNTTSRRKFVCSGLTLGAGALFLSNATSSCSNVEGSGEKTKVLTSDGQLVEIDKSQIDPTKPATPAQARHGIPNRKFVMVIDLSRCKNARLCVKRCQEAHHLLPNQEFMRVYLMQRSEKSTPYWFPKPCFHCDNPLCASVCPVGATYKRSDGIVLVDNERCIGCKFCMTGCPYNARIFMWEKKEVENEKDIEYSPETSIPAKEGTVAKCDFCPDMIRKKELPHCVSACPMGAIYFGDINEDSVTNGVETVGFTDLIREHDGYRHLEALGTEPSVYYLPATERAIPFEMGLEGKDEELMKRYEQTPYFKNKKNG